jgi:hypothetical protein
MRIPTEEDWDDARRNHTVSYGTALLGRRCPGHFVPLEFGHSVFKALAVCPGGMT